jgi:hypothetical protein
MDISVSVTLMGGERIARPDDAIAPRVLPRAGDPDIASPVACNAGTANAH